MNANHGEPDAARLRDDAAVARRIIAKTGDPYGAPLWWQLACTADTCHLLDAYEPAEAPAELVRDALRAALNLADLTPWPLPPQLPPRDEAASPLLREAAQRLVAALDDRAWTEPEWLAEAAGDALSALARYALAAAARPARPNPCPFPTLAARRTGGRR